MDQNLRIKKIETVLEGEPYSSEEIYWKDKLEKMDVFKVPLEYLIYNKYNGRILSRTKSLERQNRKIEPETEGGHRIIDALLYNSDRNRNEITKKDIEKYGQKRVGIITKDGVVIDGNRRVMLLNRIDKYNYFKAVILPVTLQENPKEIQKLETTYQMGEDEKLSYNATEKYLKTKDLLEQGVSVERIAEWMGESVPNIRKYKSVMDLMDEYLRYHDYEGIYTPLDKREGQFRDLDSWMDKFYDKESRDAFPGYKNTDVDKLKFISFDYIRARFEGKEFRLLANGRKENHFFGNKDIWIEFEDFHFDRNNIFSVKEKEEEIDYDTKNLELHLKARDDLFRKNALRFLEENLNRANQQLHYKKAANRPTKLLENSLDALKSINTENKAFLEPEVNEKVREINKKSIDLLVDKSCRTLLSIIIDILNRVDLDRIDEIENRKELLDKVVEINKTSFDMKKKLGG